MSGEGHSPPALERVDSAHTLRLTICNALLLILAGVAIFFVYHPTTEAGWFYDDTDYVLKDPRLNQLELFLPSHWSDPPPKVENIQQETLYFPGNGQPLISDRYLQRLSFALERALAGATYSPVTAHFVNIFLHLACVLALFFALRNLTRLYLGAEEDRSSERRERAYWSLLPGLASLVFAIHPWAAEPVCYVSARSASLGTFFVLLGLGLWVTMLEREVSRLKRGACLTGALLCALAAFSAKEAFVTAPAGYLLATGPWWWRRASTKSRGRLVSWGCASLVLLFVVAALGLKASERANELWSRTDAKRLWIYFFEIQNPLLLMTLFDQWPVQHISLEANHPGWGSWACAFAMACNMAVILIGLVAATRWPVCLGLCWYYLHLMPTNSILPRADFLSARNVYLSAAGIATLHAGFGLYLWARLRSWTRRTAMQDGIPALGPVEPSTGPAAPASPWRTHSWVAATVPWILPAAALSLFLFWSGTSYSYARSFLHPEELWARTARIAPAHATVRLNLACAILRRHAPNPSEKADREAALKECVAALDAENSPTMAYHSERPKALRRALAFRLLGLIHRDEKNLPEAERCFRRSMELCPSVVSWVGWAAACLEGDLSVQLQDVIEDGMLRWPEAWWPLAVRGIQRAEKLGGGRLPIEVRRDLEAAAQVPQPQLLELRSLRNMALYHLAQAHLATGN